MGREFDEYNLNLLIKPVFLVATFSYEKEFYFLQSIISSFSFNFFFFLSFTFLVADTILYKRLCPSVGPSVVIKLKSVKRRIYDAADIIACV